MAPDPVNKAGGKPRMLYSRLFQDSFFLLALLAGPLVWLLVWCFGLFPVSRQTSGIGLNQLMLAGLVYPVLEELAFRGALQSSLFHSSLGQKRYFGLSVANLLTSSLFVAFHFLTQAPVRAILVFSPSLVFGELRDRYESTRPSMLLHSFYNIGFYLTLNYA